MEELLRTNDLVLISVVESILKELDIDWFVADQAASVMDGSLGILPRRILVESDEAERARRFLREAGLGAELSERPKGLLSW